MLNKLLFFLIGKNLEEISKRAAAYFAALISSVSLPLVNAGFRLDIDQSTLAITILSIVTSVYKYIDSETKRPSEKK